MWTTANILYLSLGLPGSLTTIVLAVVAILKCFCNDRYGDWENAVKCCDKKKKSQDDDTKENEDKGTTETQPKDTDPFLPPPATDVAIPVQVEDNSFDQHNSGQSNDKSDGDDKGTDVAIPVPDYADSTPVAGTNPDVVIPVTDYADCSQVVGINQDTPEPSDHIDTMRDNIDHKILCKIKEELVNEGTLKISDVESFCGQTWDGLQYAHLRSQHHAKSPLLMAVDLANDFIRYKMAPGADPCNDNALALRKRGDEVISKLDADDQYKNCLDELDFSVDGNGYEQFQNLVDSMLEEGGVNWGRIVMVFVVGAKLAMKYNSTNLIYYTGNIVHCKFTPWIQQNGGWDSLQGLNISSGRQYNIWSWFSFSWM
ncbi:uncharacterized protein LOC117112734 [Anneissia japonica]|uniref:uncharacterized protein LOC117112734 n=1 Tax=Anneissia japonica TaxID=1529436 RepID=UPI0014256366|nr:uncharacterized protein LOC117112734 [Anneissia japonica]